MQIDFKKGIISGVIIYAVIFFAISALLVFGQSVDSLVVKAAGLLVAAFTAYYLAQKADLKDTNSALSYGVLTVIVVIALDLLITKRFNPDFNLFALNMLIGYALIAAVPVLVKGKKK